MGPLDSYQMWRGVGMGVLHGFWSPKTESPFLDETQEGFRLCSLSGQIGKRLPKKEVSTKLS